jgi:ABC-2 type transport system permease protein
MTHVVDHFSASRLWAMVAKEFIQMRRDRLTFAMMVGIPLLQLLLFGFAINSDPRDLPTAALVADDSPLARRMLSAMHNSGYFEVAQRLANEAEADAMLARGEVQFVLLVPAGFERAVHRGERPALLLLADASDPAATGNALAAITALPQRLMAEELTGPAADLAPPPAAFELIVQSRYNPEGISQYNIVPGLMGVILTMTMIMMTGLAITRERERGTMENLLATPVRPIEVMLGKIAPYILVAYVQVGLVLLAAWGIFEVPMLGSLGLLLAVVALFVLANLSIGLLFSTLAKNQMQAMQMTFFFFLPSMLLSGFMFPFRGMPPWAQHIGEILPLTHFLRIVRGILLKGNDAELIAPHLWPLLLFVAVTLGLGLVRFRRTLD